MTDEKKIHTQAEAVGIAAGMSRSAIAGHLRAWTSKGKIIA